MKKAAFGILFVLGSSLALAETWTGTVVDVMCKDKDLANHTSKCAIACAKSGFGVVLADGKFMKFDESGNSKALAAVKATSRDKDLKAKVSGTSDGDVITVETIEIQ